MAKLIIYHGDLTTEHVCEEAAVVGREKNCDLFFSDHKLSRRHARFEPTEAGVKLIDLGSRNGSWVNDVRVTEKLLTDGDLIRLGNLAIRFMVDVRDASEETHMVGAASEGDHDTLDRDQSEPSDARSTMLLRSEARSDEHERPTSKSERQDTGAVIIRGRADPEFGAMTRVPRGAPAQAPSYREGREDLQAPPKSGGAYEVTETYVEPSPGSSLDFAPVALVISLLAVVLLALPPMHLYSRSLQEETSLRGRALVDLLAAANEEELRNARGDSPSIASVRDAPGVIEAYVLDREGRILAPAAQPSERLDLTGFDIDRAQLGFRSSELEDGVLVMSKPILDGSRRVGIVVVHYRGTRVSHSVLIASAGALLVFIGGSVMLVLARRRWVGTGAL